MSAEREDAKLRARERGTGRYLPLSIHRRESAVGRTRVFFDCPFCDVEVGAYIWSLAGSGKRCTCGALHTTAGSRPAEDDPGPWGAGAAYV